MKKIISLVISLSMILSSLGVSCFAATGDEDKKAPTVSEEDKKKARHERTYRWIEGNAKRISAYEKRESEEAERQKNNERQRRKQNSDAMYEYSLKKVRKGIEARKLKDREKMIKEKKHALEEKKQKLEILTSKKTQMEAQVNAQVAENEKEFEGQKNYMQQKLNYMKSKAIELENRKFEIKNKKNEIELKECELNEIISNKKHAIEQQKQDLQFEYDILKVKKKYAVIHRDFHKQQMEEEKELKLRNNYQMKNTDMRKFSNSSSLIGSPKK